MIGLFVHKRTNFFFACSCLAKFPGVSMGMPVTSKRHKEPHKHLSLFQVRNTVMHGWEEEIEEACVGFRKRESGLREDRRRAGWVES